MGPTNECFPMTILFALHEIMQAADIAACGTITRTSLNFERRYVTNDSAAPIDPPGEWMIRSRPGAAGNPCTTSINPCTSSGVMETDSASGTPPLLVHLVA